MYAVVPSTKPCFVSDFAAEHLRDAEVRDLRLPSAVQEHVVRLQVAVQVAEAVGVRDSREDLREDRDRVARLDRSGRAQELVHRARVHELHDEVVELVLEEVVLEPDDVRMVERLQRVDLEEEAPLEAVVRRRRGLEHLDRDRLVSRACP